MTKRRRISTRDRVALFQREGVAEAFFSRFLPEPNSGCWIWEGASKAKGYGHMNFGHTMVMATHVSLYLHGWVPNEEGLIACHSCDTPPCVNPDHLWWGKEKQNTHDCMSKGRLRPGVLRGNANASSKLTIENVIEIRSAIPHYGYLRYLSERFGVGRSTITKVRSGNTWAEL